MSIGMPREEVHEVQQRVSSTGVPPESTQRINYDGGRVREREEKGTKRNFLNSGGRSDGYTNEQPVRTNISVRGGNVRFEVLPCLKNVNQVTA